MKPKVMLTIALLVFVAVAAAYLVVDETRNAAQRADARASGQALPAGAERVEGGSADTTAQVAAQPESAKPTAPADAKVTGGASPKPARVGGSGTPAAAASVSEASEREGKTPAPVAASGPRVIAYYFHATQRCATCRKLEAYSHDAITQGFEQQLKDGTLTWRTVNTDEPENTHFVNDYKLYTRSLVIVKLQDGRQADWKNLERIWDLVDDKAGFIQYVQREINAFLGTS